MAKYIALVDIPPNVKKGDEVELKEDPIPEFEKKLQPIELAKKKKKEEVTNPDREALKARATELEIDFPNNASNARLMELIEAKEKANAEAEGEGAGEGEE